MGLPALPHVEGGKSRYAMVMVTQGGARRLCITLRRCAVAPGAVVMAVTRHCFVGVVGFTPIAFRWWRSVLRWHAGSGGAARLAAD